MTTSTIHCGYVPGCIGRIAELHAQYYHQLVGFGLTFEAKVTRELTQFCENYDKERDGLWLLINSGRVEGSIAIDGHGADGDGAHLRWFITSDNARGNGNGASLLMRAIEFCQHKNYRQIHLSTFEGLNAARHLYEKFGFVLVDQKRGVQWGTEVNEQRFLRRA
jgi:GNAT superfamily N-acetyltransferase